MFLWTIFCPCLFSILREIYQTLVYCSLKVIVLTLLFCSIFGKIYFLLPFFLFYKTDTKNLVKMIRAITKWGVIEKAQCCDCNIGKFYIWVGHQKLFRIFKVPILFSATVEHTVLHRNEFIIFFLLLLTITSTCEEVIFMVYYKQSPSVRQRKYSLFSLPQSKRGEGNRDTICFS